MDEFVGGAFNRRRAGGSAGRVQHKLPLALIKEQAEGEIGADERGKGGEDDSLDQPDWADNLGLRRRWRGTLVWLGDRARHRSLFSTLALAAGE